MKRQVIFSAVVLGYAVALAALQGCASSQPAEFSFPIQGRETVCAFDGAELIGCWNPETCRQLELDSASASFTIKDKDCVVTVYASDLPGNLRFVNVVGR